MLLCDLYGEKIRYLTAGGFNTVLGYSISVGLYSLLHPHLHIVLISLITSVITVTLSFSTYKYFVFKTKDDWMKEYIRSYSVYGVSIVLGIFFIWILVDLVQIPFWIAQMAVLILTAFISYVGHKNYTFNTKK